MTCDPDCLWSQNITPGLETGIDYEFHPIESYIASTLEEQRKGLWVYRCEPRRSLFSPLRLQN